MAGKRPSQESPQPSKSPESGVAPAKPASAPATRVLPQRQGLYSPRGSSAGKTSQSTRPSSSGTQQRNGPEKQSVPTPIAAGTASAQLADAGALQQQQQAPEEQSSSPRPTRPRNPAGAPGSRPTSGIKRLTRSDAEEARAAAEKQAEVAAAEAERQAAEDAEQEEEDLLEQAAEIRRLRDSLARPAPPAAEPKRAKTHWDHLLEEMTWLSKEFQKERKWKLNMAKKYVRAVARSNLDLESRSIVKQRDAELAIRRKAAFVGKEVMQFWKKAERVMVYKRQSQLDARKKVAMDKHLSFLVDQTQKYSSLLAQRLGVGGEELLALPAPQTGPRAEDCTLGQAQAAKAPPAPDVKTEETVIDAQDAEDAARGSAAVTHETPQDAQEKHVLAHSGADDRMDVSEEDHADSSQAAEPSLPADQGVAALGQEQPAGEDEGDDFRAGTGSDEEDDEATLEEEEALARAAGEESGDDGELAALNDEADMPLEQLMALYGYVPEGGDSAEEASPSKGPAGQDDHKETRTKAGKGIAASDKHGDAGMRASSPMDDGSQEMAEQDADENDDKQSKGLADLMQKEGGEDGGADEDYASSGSEADDEATLEEEDALAAQDGLDQKEEEDAEVTALAGEADMPLEQLLAMYGMVIDEDQAGTQVKAEGIVGEASDPSRPRKRRRLASDADAEGPKATQTRMEVNSDAELKQAANGSRQARVVPATPGVAAPSVVPQASHGVEEDAPAAEEDADRALAELEKVTDGKAKLEGVARLAEQAQPKGSTLDSAGVHTPVPFLLKGSLREYQHVGLDWLVTIYTRRLNGILADEMGLGKTIMTIALLAHLACEKGVWGPHLIVVPTSVMLNWEVECKKWCPAFKLLTYYGSAKERKAKRQGWSKPNAFHICITSYTLVLQDAKMFRRKKWKYLILDEAHMIKNWKSQRWQTLLNFSSQRRLLITGTPLQNDLMELWSLMHFLMPQVFASHAQFKDWFSNPLTGMVEGQEAVNKVLVERLHSVLRPFLLRRLKRDVEKQLPGKHEHIIKCRLSKRQRTLYEDYMAASDVRSTLSSGNFLGIINVLMQLRKVCNHPDLFEGRSIISAFDMLPAISIQEPSAVLNLRQQDPASTVSLGSAGSAVPALQSMSAWEAAEVQALETPGLLIQELAPSSQHQLARAQKPFAASLSFQPSAAAHALVQQSVAGLQARRRAAELDRRQLMVSVNERRCSAQPAYGEDLLRAVHVEFPVHHVNIIKEKRGRHLDFSQAIADAVKTATERAEEVDDCLKTFMFVIPKCRAAAPEIWCSRPDPSAAAEQQATHAAMQRECFARSQPLRTALVRQQVFFPDRRLIQFDCGKLQELAILLRKLKSGGHKALIFTQMARMLDVLEVFLNLHGYTYVRLDGTTKPEQRQILMQRYNTNPKLFIFILSTRSGGVGMNLTGADTVIFYDSDWNPAMDAQAQDRCHRIGQTREVHIYRLVSESTIEENILHKSDQKRQLDHLAIQSGGFNTDFLQKFNPRELLGIQAAAAAAGASGAAGQLSAEEMQAAMQSVEDETDQAAAQALQLETEAELAEFNADPAPKHLDPEAEEDDNDADDTRDPEASGALEKPSQSAAASQPSTELPPVKAEAEEGGMDMMDDVAAMAGHGMSTDPLATLESVLRPVERYAVHFLEEQAAITAEVEAAAAAVEAELDAQEWNMQEIERIQEEQEAEIEEDVEATRVLDWDTAAADTAYRAKVEEAEARQRLLLEQRAREEAAWLEQQEALLAMQAALPVHQPIYTSRAARKTRTPELDDAESQQYSPYPRFSRKRARTARGRTVVRPRWPGEDATPSGSREDSDGGLSSADEASQPWPGARSKRHASMLSPQSARQRSRLAGSSAGYPPEPAGIKREATEAHSPGLLGASGVSDVPQPYNTARQYPQIGQLRAPAHVWLPWDVLEDVVLATMVEEAETGRPGEAQKEVSAAVWQLISDALAAGAATLSTTAAAAASQPVKLRLAQQCRERYELLLAALQASRSRARPAAALPATSTPGASLAHSGPVSIPVPPPSAALSAANQAPVKTSQGTSPAGSAAGAAASTGLPNSLPVAAAAPAGVPAGGQAVTSMAMQALAPLQPGSLPALAGSSPAAPGRAPQQGPASDQAQPAQLAPGGAAAQQSSGRALDGSVQADLPGQQRPEAKILGGPGSPSQAWSLAAGLETVREHLAWLASSNIVCSPEGLRTVAAAAMGGQLPVEGSSAAQMADVMAELQSLPRNGQLRAAGTARTPPLHKSFPGSAEQFQPLQVAQADAVAVKAAVVMAAGAPSRGVIRHLDAIVSAVRSGGVKAGNTALRQLLHMPRHPALPASSAPQLRPPASQQQQQLHGSAGGVLQGSARPVGGPVPRQMYNQAGAGMYAGYQGQYTPNIQGQSPGMRHGMPAAAQPPQQVPGMGVLRPYLQGSQVPGQMPGSGQTLWRPQQSQAGFGLAARPGLPAQPGLPAYLRPALMQQVQQVVGHMQPGTGGVQRAPQPAVPLIPGLQALLAQQAATRPGALQGQPTSSQSQQYNLALLHSLLAQAHSAGAPAGVAIPGSASQPARPYLPTLSTFQTGALAQGMTQAARPQLPVSGASQMGQPGALAQGTSQGWQPGLPTPGLPGPGFRPLQRPALAVPPIPAPALKGVPAEGRSTQLAATLTSVNQQSQQVGQSASLEQGNVNERQGK